MDEDWNTADGPRTNKRTKVQYSYIEAVLSTAHARQRRGGRGGRQEEKGREIRRVIHAPLELNDMLDWEIGYKWREMGGIK